MHATNGVTVGSGVAEGHANAMKRGNAAVNCSANGWSERSGGSVATN